MMPERAAQGDPGRRVRSGSLRSKWARPAELILLAVCSLLFGSPGRACLQRVLAKLLIRDWQALSQTSRSCRQLLADSQDILQALVQVHASFWLAVTQGHVSVLLLLLHAAPPVGC